MNMQREKYRGLKAMPGVDRSKNQRDKKKTQGTAA
jgi:hypothetical protein